MLKIIDDNTLDVSVSSLRYLLNKSDNSELVRNLAVQITQNKEDPISAIYDWVKANVRYVPDPIDYAGNPVELFISPIKMVNDYYAGLSIGGDCDDHALLTAALLRSIGIKANIMIVAVQSDEYDHALVQAYSDKLGTTIIVDTTSSKPLGWEDKYNRRLII